jgi:hypothetical protein
MVTPLLWQANERELQSSRGEDVRIIALLIIFAALQMTRHLPITVEVERDVEVTGNTESAERRGILYLDNLKAESFRLKKGQRFQMIAVGQEGGCRIRFDGKEYGLTSCPWLEGFRDHQTDVFRVVTKK